MVLSRRTAVGSARRRCQDASLDFMLFAFAVDLTIWLLVGYLVGHYGKRHLPDPLKDTRLVVAIFLIVGAMVTMVSFPHWAVYPD